MRALTLAQPHAILAAYGFKKLDGRGYRTAYRGTVAIYAARWRAGMDRRAFRELCFSEPFRQPIYRDLRTTHCLRMPRGCIIGLAELVDVQRIDGDDMMPPYPEREFGCYAPLRYVWTLEDCRPLPRPIPVRRGWARSGLWKLPRPLREKIRVLESGVRA